VVLTLMVIPAIYAVVKGVTVHSVEPSRVEASSEMGLAA